MKNILFVILLIITTKTYAQTVERNVKYNCFPPNGTNKILNKPDTNSIHPSWIASFKGGSSLGSSWSFIASKLITNRQGKFLYGDIYSPRGGKLNVKQNGYDGPVYVYYKDWDCL